MSPERDDDSDGASAMATTSKIAGGLDEGERLRLAIVLSHRCVVEGRDILSDLPMSAFEDNDEDDGIEDDGKAGIVGRCLVDVGCLTRPKYSSSSSSVLPSYLLLSSASGSERGVGGALPM
jgi:hypothetical protein